MHMQGDWEVLLNGDPQEIRQLCTWGHSINYFRLWGGVRFEKPSTLQLRSTAS